MNPKRPRDPNQLAKSIDPPPAALPERVQRPSRKTDVGSNGALPSHLEPATVPNMENTRMPSKRALAVLDEPPPAEPVNKRLRISKKTRAAIDAMVSGQCKTVGEAAEKGGMARESLSRALSTPHVAAYLREKVLRHLAIAAARAGAVKVDLMECDNAMVADRASTFVLGLADIQPATSPSLNVNIEMKAGYCIDLRDDPPPMRTIPHN